MQWWFYLATPVAFSLIIFRVVQNLVEDVGKYKRGEPFKIQADVSGD